MKGGFKMAESVSKTFKKPLLRLFGSSGVSESNQHQMKELSVTQEVV